MTLPSQGRQGKGFDESGKMRWLALAISKGITNRPKIYPETE